MAGYTPWNDPSHPAYWNRVLKDEGLAVITGREVVNKRKLRAEKERQERRRREQRWQRRVSRASR